MIRKWTCLVLALLLFPALAGAVDVTQSVLGAFDPTVPNPDLPEEVQEMLEIARGELAKLDWQPIERTNDYSRWYFYDERRIGWCVTFAGWCAEKAGLPMVKEAAADAGEVSDEPLFFPMEAKVVLASRAFEKTGRLSQVPHAGDAVIYGVRGSTPYTHFGLVESVREREDGIYEITTLEGNVSNTVKRYCYRYDPTPKKKNQNMSVVPQEERVVEEAQYKLHKDTWYIHGFGQTYLTEGQTLQNGVLQGTRLEGA